MNDKFKITDLDTLPFQKSLTTVIIIEYFPLFSVISPKDIVVFVVRVIVLSLPLLTILPSLIAFLYSN